MKKRLIPVLCVLLLASCSKASIPAPSSSTAPAPVPATPSSMASAASIASPLPAAARRTPIVDPTEIPLDEVYYTQGPNGTEATPLSVGDTFMGLTLVKQGGALGNGLGYPASFADPFEGLPHYNIVLATFEGPITARGELSFHLSSPGRIAFSVAEEYRDLFPCIIRDDRNPWFSFDNDEGFCDVTGISMPSDDEPLPDPIYCEITIDSYTIVLMEASVANRATIVSCRPL